MFGGAVVGAVLLLGGGCVIRALLPTTSVLEWIGFRSKNRTKQHSAPHSTPTALGALWVRALCCGPGRAMAGIPHPEALQQKHQQPPSSGTTVTPAQGPCGGQHSMPEVGLLDGRGPRLGCQGTFPGSP